jgi:uncharacterized protein involved in exopolysaccharide biosynthesis
MEGQELVLHSGNKIVSFTLRDFAAMAFRRRRIMLLCFCGILLGTLLSALLFPSYRAQTEILVRRQRVDTAVSAEQNSPMVVSSLVTEEEINSEVELIKSEDVLRQVVLQTGLDKRPSITGAIFGPHDPERKVAKAINRLDSSLSVDSIPKTNVIRITYSSANRQMAARVLEVLNAVYLQKHKEVQRPAGQFEFFNKQVESAKAELQAAEDKLKQFPKTTGTANPTLSRDITLQKVNEFNLSLGQTRSSIAETQKKIDAMEALQKTTPARMTTQMRQQDDAPVLQQMKSTLLALELKRSDLASKYQADYPPLQELDLEIASTKAAINGEKPLNDVTTDQNPAYAWMNSELVKDKSDLRGYQAKAAETETLVRETLASARELDEQGIEQGDLVRTAKAAEENYLLYLRKREEARISDAFDQQSILNVAIAEKPTVPSLPSESPLMFGLIGTFLALTVSAGVVFAVEYFDPSFRSPSEVEAVLQLPVLAAVPDKNWSAGGNGLGVPRPATVEIAAGSVPSQGA